jgi:hypothetical protein
MPVVRANLTHPACLDYVRIDQYRPALGSGVFSFSCTFGSEISNQQPAFCNEDLHWLDINDEDVNLHYKLLNAEC